MGCVPTPQGDHEVWGAIIVVFLLHREIMRYGCTNSMCPHSTGRGALIDVCPFHRVTMRYGGSDITRMFYWLLKQVSECLCQSLPPSLPLLAHSAHILTPPPCRPTSPMESALLIADWMGFSFRS